MAAEFIEMLKEEFNLDNIEINLMHMTLRQIKGADRRNYYMYLKPREKYFRAFLKNKYNSLESEEQRQWSDTVVQSMLALGGEPDISDSIVMDVIGRISVYNRMRLKAEKEGIILNALAGFGGMSYLLMLVIIFTALFLFFIQPIMQM